MRGKKFAHLYKIIDGEEHKLCPTCKQFFPLSSSRPPKVVNGVKRYYRCRPCVIERKKWYTKSPRGKETKRAWEAANYDKVREGNRIASLKYIRSKKGKEARRKYYADNENAERKKEVGRRRSNEGVRNLADHYVRCTLAGRSVLKPSQFPQEVVDAERELMKIRRYIRGGYQEGSNSKGDVHEKCS